MDFLGHGKLECDIYEYYVNQRKYEHCGQCEELPCSRCDREDLTKTKESIIPVHLKPEMVLKYEQNFEV